MSYHLEDFNSELTSDRTYTIWRIFYFRQQEPLADKPYTVVWYTRSKILEFSSMKIFNHHLVSIRQTRWRNWALSEQTFLECLKSQLPVSIMKSGKKSFWKNPARTRFFRHTEFI